MSEEIGGNEFLQAGGVEDWRILGEGACAFFGTDSLAAGATLVTAIAELAAGSDEQPDIDVRPEGVIVRLITIRHDYYGISRSHIDLARRISAAARDMGLAADPSRSQTIQVTIDALSHPHVIPFWRAVLGYRDRDDEGEDLMDPLRRNAPFWFQRMDVPRSQRNRVHIDVWVPHDQARDRVSAAIAAGGRLVNDGHAPAFWVLADPEGNEACVASISMRD